jgi:cytochrome P450
MFYSIYLTHRDPAIWDNPDQFQPERFARGSTPHPKAQTASEKTGASYIPFGSGPRACIGAAFGQAEARIVVSQLLKTFDFQLLTENIHPHMGATLEPRPGVMMKITLRQSSNLKSKI